MLKRPDITKLSPGVLHDDLELLRHIAPEQWKEILSRWEVALRTADGFIALVRDYTIEEDYENLHQFINSRGETVQAVVCLAMDCGLEEFSVAVQKEVA